MIVKINSYVICGMDSIPIVVEVGMEKGLPKFEIIGLADTATKESKERVFKSITGLGYKIPLGNITVNLAPAKIRKKGTLYDLPIALGILMASKQIEIPDDLARYLIAGELSLDGEVREVPGLFITALQKLQQHDNNEYTEDLSTKVTNPIPLNHPYAYLIPERNYTELQMFPPLQDHIYPLKTLSEAISTLEAPTLPSSERTALLQRHPQARPTNPSTPPEDFRDVLGNENAKLAIQLAVINRLNLLLIGPPGGGKSMLMSRIKTILPSLSKADSLAVTQIHHAKGVMGAVDARSGENAGDVLVSTPPFRSVHSSIHTTSLIGGGKFPEPGEVSLAHKGFLFLDELSEFGKQALQSLRTPLENKTITINRMEGKVTFPCDFTLLACTNPCPCGYYGDETKMCTCSKPMMARFYSKLSGPILDRFDMIIFVNGFDRKSFQTHTIDSATMRREIELAVAQKSLRPNPYIGKTLPEVFREFPLFEDLVLKSIERKLFSLRKVKSILKTCYTLELLHHEPLSREIILTAIDLCRNKIILD